MRRAVLCASFAIAGCGGEDTKEEALTVSAAASLTEAFESYAESTDADEAFSFAGSDDLSAQIRQGAPVDVFAAANARLPRALFDEGLVEEPVEFIENELVLAVRPDTGIGSLDDLMGDDVDLAIGAAGVPVGDLTREALAGLPTSERRAILGNVRSEEADVKGVVAKLVAGAADAGFVYASDVTATGGDLRALQLPRRLETEATYAVAVVTGSDQPDAAQDFVDGLLGDAGQRTLLEAGFQPIEGE